MTEDYDDVHQNYYDRYKDLKRKLRFLLFENQAYQDELRQSQKKLLQVTRDKNFLLERLMKYEGASSESEEEPEDKSRQGFSPAPPHFKRPNVRTMTPQAPSNITMPSPRGVMQSPSYGSPRPNHSPTLASPSTTYASPVPTAPTSPKQSPRSRKASSTEHHPMVRKPPFPPAVAEPVTRGPQLEKFPIVSVTEPTMFCSHFDNGVQCTTEITKKSKTKLCGPHRRMLNKKKKQQNAGEELINSPNPLTPSSTMSPVTPTPHPTYHAENMMHMIPSRSYRPPTAPAMTGYPPMFPNQIAPHPGTTPAQQAQYQAQMQQMQQMHQMQQMQRMMYQRELYSQRQQQGQQQAQKQDVKAEKTDEQYHDTGHPSGTAESKPKVKTEHPQHPGPPHPRPQHPRPQHPRPQHPGPQHPTPQHLGQPHPGLPHPTPQLPRQPHPGPPHPPPQHPGKPHPGPPHPGPPHPGPPHPGPPHAAPPHPGPPHPTPHPTPQHPGSQHPGPQHPTPQFPQPPQHAAPAQHVPPTPADQRNAAAALLRGPEVAAALLRGPDDVPPELLAALDASLEEYEKP